MLIITRFYDVQRKRVALRVRGPNALEPTAIRAIPGVWDVSYEPGCTIVYPKRNADSLSIEQDLARRLGVRS